jgi:hypothetical protein
LRVIKHFLREAALTKAEERPCYEQFKQLAGTLQIYVDRGEIPKQGIQPDAAENLSTDSRGLLKDTSSPAKLLPHEQIKKEVIRSLSEEDVYQIAKERALRLTMIKLKREAGQRPLMLY